MFAYHATTMANTVSAPLLVFSRQGGMPVLLSHYRPDHTIFAFTGEQQPRRDSRSSTVLHRSAGARRRIQRAASIVCQRCRRRFHARAPARGTTAAAAATATPMTTPDNPQVQRHLSLYHGVTALLTRFTASAEETFDAALSELVARGFLTKGQVVTLVQSGVSGRRGCSGSCACGAAAASCICCCCCSCCVRHLSHLRRLLLTRCSPCAPT